MTNMKTAMKKRIHAYDFAILELGLYLDTHTWDKRALKKRQQLQAERRNAIAAYEEKFGPYVVNWNKVEGDAWCWVNDPWPWEFCAREDV